MRERTLVSHLKNPHFFSHPHMYFSTSETHVNGEPFWCGKAKRTAQKHARRKRMEKRYQIINGKVSFVEAPAIIEKGGKLENYFPKHKIIPLNEKIKSKSSLIIKLLCVGAFSFALIENPPRSARLTIPPSLKVFFGKCERIFACAFF